MKLTKYRKKDRSRLDSNRGRHFLKKIKQMDMKKVVRNCTQCTDGAIVCDLEPFRKIILRLHQYM